MALAPDLPITVLAAAAVVGAVLAVCGWRGRRTDGHPLCRRCGYDLVGRSPDTRVCSECGADLTGRRRVRVGHRARRPLWVAAGLVLLAPGAARVGELGWRHAAAFDYTPHKPTAWLIADTGLTADSAARLAALDELHARLSRGRLTREHAAAIADHATAALRTPQWSAGFASLVNDAYAADTLPHDAWERYWRAAVTIAVTPRPSVTIGDPLPFRVDARMLPEAGQMTELRGRVVAWAVGEGAATRGAWEPITAADLSAHESSWTPAAGAGGRTRFVMSTAAPPTIPRLHAAPPGPQTLWCRVELDLRVGNKTSGRVRSEASAPFTLLPRDQPSVQLVRDPVLDARVADGLHVSQLKRLSDGRIMCVLHQTAARPPVTHYRAYLCDAGTPGAPTGPMGTAVLGPGEQSRTIETRTPWRFEPAAPRIVLVPDRAAAAATIDVSSLPADPIVLKVPVRSAELRRQ